MNKINRIIFIVFFTWTTLVSSAFLWSYHNLSNQHQQLALQTSRAFFHQIVLDRRWNANHGGVYVPITEQTKPNPYLIDPLRDIETKQGLKLTKINPAFMTRQISEIAQQDNGSQFHITSLKPIRPENKPSEWEAAWLKSFAKGAKEQGEFYLEKDVQKFRYMAPLITEKSCLKCHAHQGYKQGEIRGGISVTLPLFHKLDYLPIILGYGVAGITGIAVILISGMLLKKSRQELLNANNSLEGEIQVRKKIEDKQKKLIAELQTAITEIKTLRGIVPICSHCKQIRDDQGYWNRVDTYISQHTEAMFSHSICPSCLKKYYKDVNKPEE